jgi:hypothetical protein
MNAVPKSSGWEKTFEKFLTGDKHDNGEHRGFCPIHEDPELSKTPSASYNFSKSIFNCFGGCGGMSFSRLLNVCQEEWPEDFPRGSSAPDSGPRSSVRSINDAPSKRGDAQPLPTDEEVRSWVETLQRMPSMLAVMTANRGLSEATIEKYEIGWHKDRFTIPVRDADGVLQNVRRYKASINGRSVAAKDKMLNLQGHGEARLFLPWMLSEPEVIITEGELDAIIGQEHGLPTMSHTAGASVWKSQWSPLFQEKTVFICYDVDDAGTAGALKVAAGISRYAKAVYIIKLPMPVKGSDLTNFFVDQGYTAKDFRELMEEARLSPYGRKAARDRQGVEPKHVTLEHSLSTEHRGQPLELIVTVAGKVQPPYILPRKVHFMCDQSHSQAACAKCPMSSLGGDMVERIAKDDPFLLELIDSGKGAADTALKKRVNITSRCTVVEIEPEDEWNVEELIVLPSVYNRDEQTQTPITRKIYNVGEYATPVNTTSRLVGFNTAEPKNGRAVFQAYDSEQTKTNIDTFELTPELLEGLKVFQPKKNQPVLKKMGDIARDLEANVTKIYGRVPLHVAYDAVWHSVMDFRFKGVLLGKGWLELLVLGDTRTGKSEAALRLSDHYNAGVMKSCEGATFAGLVGGAEQAGTKSWMVRWGTIPLNDRRLVVLDEVSGIADKNIMEQMSSVRSSGRAQITKIVSQETSARTRLIWIGNPVDGTTLRHMNGAIEGIQKLVKNPEDIARFDLAMAVASDEVESDLINSTSPPEVKHIYTSELCSALVSWAWSRKAEQVIWNTGTEDYVLRVASEMGERYVPEPPLIQVENARVKLARISVAIAARVFSCDKSGQNVVVGNEHVDAARDLLDTLYGAERFGYRRHSTRAIRDRIRAEENKRQCRMYLMGDENVLYTLIQSRGDKFRPRDFEESGSMHKDQAQEAVRQLGQWKMLKRAARGFLQMEPALVDILSELEDRFDE